MYSTKISLNKSQPNKIETTLREYEKRYRSLLKNGKGVFFALSTNGIITSLNFEFKKLTGLSCDQWIGKSFTSLFHPEDLSLALERFKKNLSGEAVPLNCELK